jgi:hypothetical protein
MSERIAYETLAAIALDTMPAVVEEPGIERGHRLRTESIPTPALPRLYADELVKEPDYEKKEVEEDHILDLRAIKHSIQRNESSLRDLGKIFDLDRDTYRTQIKTLQTIVMHLYQTIEDLKEENQRLFELIHNHNKKVSSDDSIRIKIRGR